MNAAWLLVTSLREVRGAGRAALEGVRGVIVKLEMRMTAVAAALVLSGVAWAADPEVRFNGTTPIAATNLSDENGCVPTGLTGRVVKRVFAADEIMVKSVTIEQPSGERILINVDDDKINLAKTAARADAVRALQIMLREGSRASFGVYACGVAGRVLMLDSIR